MNEITVRDYARKEGITIGTAYRRLWEGQVRAIKVLGRWVVQSEEAATEDVSTPSQIRRSENDPAGSPCAHSVRQSRKG